MTNLTPDEAALRELVRKMVREGNTFSAISKELGISWSLARSYTDGSSWRGIKQRTTRRLHEIEKESDPAKRKESVSEVIRNVDFLYDAANHLKGQVDKAREALDR